MDSEEKDWIDSVRDVVLPEWLQECLPEQKPVCTVFWEADAGDTPFVVRDTDGAVLNSFKTVEDAYDSIKEGASDVVFDASVDGHGCSFSMGGVTVDSEGPFVRMLFSLTDETRMALLKSEYKDWTEQCYPEYQRDPSDLQGSYYFVSRHPAFWTRHESKPTFSWETSEYMRKIWHALSTDDEGRVFWMIEGGGHVEPEYTSHYHDLRLDAYGATFEEAVVNFAALVDNFFNVDGSPREGVDYEPSAFEVLIKERMEEVDRAEAEWEASKNA